MISDWSCARRMALCLGLCFVAACGDGPAGDREGALIEPPLQCSDDRPDCSISEDYPVASELTPENSAGLRYSEEAGALVIDRVSKLPDEDGDGVPDDADDCPGTPDWISCDGDPSNDGVYATLFYDPTAALAVEREVLAATTADIPAIDVYFLIDATPTLADEITVLQDQILSIIADVRARFDDARFGLGLYREYALDPLADPYSQAPYHHILDLTDDETLVQTAMSTLNTVANASPGSAATQALYSVASGLGLGDAVPNRGTCPEGATADIGYPCFRPDVLHVVMNITDAPVYNGPDPTGLQYGDPPFAPDVGTGVTTLPPVEMFPALFEADDATNPLDLGDLSGRSLTLMGMSTLLTNRVTTSAAPGCAPPPPVPPDDPVGGDMDGKDAVLALRFDASVGLFDAFSNNTHWPGANVALFDDALLDPLAALACDGGTLGVGSWGAISYPPAAGQQYYLVIDGIIPASEPGHEPEGAFSLSIVHDGDPANPTWLTTDAPVAWQQVETALLANDIRVASVVTLRDALSSPSEGNADARLMAAATDALTKIGDEWVTELASADGDGLESAVSNTIAQAETESGYDISVVALEDETDFVVRVGWNDCAFGETLDCADAAGNTCFDCSVGAALVYDVLLVNRTVPPMSTAQIFDFELRVTADDSIEVERIPVRVMVPDESSHSFDDLPATAFYRNSYDTTARCITPPERPKWGNLTWEGLTPEGTSIEFQIRTANTAEELPLAIPAIVTVTPETEGNAFDLTAELIADGLPYGLPYLQITAILNPSSDPPATPELTGWTFQFFCEAAE